MSPSSAVSTKQATSQGHCSTTAYFIGLDAGSSVIKAAVFDHSGRQLSEAQKRTPLLRPHPGWSELDPDHSFDAAVEVISQAVTESGLNPEQFGGIGLSAAMVGAWIVDRDGHALRPGIIWEDSRSQSIIEELVEREPQVLSRIFKSSGSVMQQGCTLPVLAWLVRHEPQLITTAAHVLSYKDYLRLKLTGQIATDRSEASVIPGDARSRDRSDAMIALFGLDAYRHLLPKVRESEEFVGGLETSIAKRLGLPAGLPVAVGAGDVAATVIGAGGLNEGAAVAVLGTTAMVGVCHSAPVFDPPDIGLLFSLPSNLWYRAMVNVAGTLNLDWAISTLAPDLSEHEDRYDLVTRLAASTSIGAGGLTYLPYLSESGIIAPVVAPDARAQFCGLTSRHARAHLFRAVFEGVAFALKDLTDALDIPMGPLVLTGGGGRSSFWSQMISDCLQRPILVPDGTQFGARGAALLAATAAGLYPDARQASAAVGKDGTIYLPQPDHAAAYQLAHAAYRRHRDRLLMAIER